MTYDVKARADTRELRSSVDETPAFGGGERNLIVGASACGMSIAIDYLRRHVGAVPHLRHANTTRVGNCVNVIRMRP